MMAVKSMFFLFVIVICVVLLISYAVTGNISFWQELGIKTGSLTISGAVANVTYLLMNDSSAITENFCTSIPASCTINPLGDSIRLVQVRAIINRTSGDCNNLGGGTVIAYICNGTVSTCTDANDDYGPTLNFLNGQQWSTLGCPNCLCNYTGTFNLDYYKHWGDWTINVTANIPGVGTNFSLYRLYIPSVPGYAYPYTILNGEGTNISFGALSSNAWNFGKGINVSKNMGNTKLSLVYNISNFTTSAGSYIIATSGYIPPTCAIQNISTNPFAPTYNYNYKNMSGATGNMITTSFNVTGGVKRCGSTCSAGDEDGGPNEAYYNLYWSLYIPPAQYVTTYTCNITSDWTEVSG